jgi:hypothetical protein
MTTTGRCLWPVALALCAGPVLVLPQGATARPPFRATLSCPQGHHPRVDTPWPIIITARTYRGTPLSGRIRYQFLYRGKVVARRSNYRFRNGRFRDELTFPAAALGRRLTFRAVVSTRLGRVNLDYWVEVRR